MLSTPVWVNDATAFVGLFIALCAALAMCWKIARPAFIESVREVVKAEIAPVIADQAEIRTRLTDHLHHEEMEIAEIKHALGVGGRIDIRFGEIEHELLKHVADHRGHIDRQ
jgi:hypothetical protein